MLPGTGAECFFHTGTRVQVDGLAEGEAVIAPAAFALCNRRRMLQLTALGPVTFIAVRFRAGQLRHFVAASFSELQDRLTPAADLWRHCAQLEESLALAANFSARAQLLAAFFLQQLQNSRDPLLDSVLTRLYYAPNTRIEQLAEQAGWGRRNFDKRFLALYGVPPKYFARVARLLKVVRRLALHPQERLLDSALDAGYFDQAHFCHDLQGLTGLSPAALRADLIRRSHFYNPSFGAKSIIASR